MTTTAATDSRQALYELLHACLEEAEALESNEGKGSEGARSIYQLAYAIIEEIEEGEKQG